MWVKNPVSEVVLLIKSGGNEVFTILRPAFFLIFKGILCVLCVIPCVLCVLCVMNLAVLFFLQYDSLN
jgi:hypothetical protein